MMYKWTEDGTLFNATVFEYHLEEFRTNPDVWDYATPEDIAEELSGSIEWDPDLCEALCEEAGMLKEWRSADEDTYRTVVEAAADKLGVEIL